MDTNAYVTFLVVGVILVVIDGQIIYHSGKRFLDKGDRQAGSSMTNLVTVLFHLVVLGVLALMSTIDFPGGSSMAGIIGRVGVMLLVLALAHAITLGVLTRMREEQVAENVKARINAPVQRTSEARVDPITGAEEVRRTSTVDQRMPYTTES
ncbi:hypothetical protein [Amycolatopsis pigmentata]|uniref:Integral membrane protein n=1 Tax=Amycolatopsis pigmentata TaxID=450801 RepID=A0ABW5FRL0_9PSEU